MSTHNYTHNNYMECNNNYLLVGKLPHSITQTITYLLLPFHVEFEFEFHVVFATYCPMYV